MVKLNKSRVGFIFALPAWGLLFLAFEIAIGYLPTDAPEAYEKVARYIALHFFLLVSSVILFLSSIVLATWGLKKDKWFSILTFTVHGTVVFVLLFLFF